MPRLHIVEKLIVISGSSFVLFPPVVPAAMPPAYLSILFMTPKKG